MTSVDRRLGTARSVAIYGSHAYVASDGAAPLVVDISNPVEPEITGSVSIFGEVRSVVIYGDYAYVAARESGVQVSDVTNPVNAQIAGSVDAPDLPGE